MTRASWAITVAIVAVTATVLVVMVQRARAPVHVSAPAPTPTVAAVGPMASMFGLGATTLPVDPQHSGDVEVVVAENDYAPVHLTAVTGGGVDSWTTAIVATGKAEPHAYAIAYGTVAETGPATVTFGWSGPVSTGEYEAQEFSGGSTWTLDDAGLLDNAASATVTYPTLFQAQPTDLVFGFADYGTAPATGTAKGYTYVTTPDHNQVAYGADVTEPPASELPAPARSTTVAVALAP